MEIGNKYKIGEPLKLIKTKTIVNGQIITFWDESNYKPESILYTGGTKPMSLPEEKSYDSYSDTMIHKNNIFDVMLPLIEALQIRMNDHDKSKLEKPEKEGYDKFIPLLRTAKYGTPEYNKIREDMMTECLSHHYEVNRHHPEHFENGLADMNIVDFFEYFCDCYASSLVSDTPFEKGVEINAKKHNLPDVMVSIFKNTVRDYF